MQLEPFLEISLTPFRKQHAYASCLEELSSTSFLKEKNY